MKKTKKARRRHAKKEDGGLDTRPAEELANALEGSCGKVEGFLADFGSAITKHSSLKGNGGLVIKKKDAAPQTEMKECAVCGEKGNFTINKHHKGKDYYFCNGSCKWMFVKDPENFKG